MIEKFIVDVKTLGNEAAPFEELEDKVLFGCI